MPKIPRYKTYAYMQPVLAKDELTLVLKTVDLLEEENIHHHTKRRMTMECEIYQTSVEVDMDQQVAARYSIQPFIIHTLYHCTEHNYTQ